MILCLEVVAKIDQAQAAEARIREWRSQTEGAQKAFQDRTVEEFRKLGVPGAALRNQSSDVCWECFKVQIISRFSVIPMKNKRISYTYIHLDMKNSENCV